MSRNISKEKREELLRQIGEIRAHLEQNADDSTDKLLMYLSNLEKDVDGKKYGLVFEEHEEAVDVLCRDNVPILKEETELKIDNGGTQNFLIEGDNLASLKLLEKTHKGKIDLIYIDPPYNTGKSFIYNDKVIGDDDEFKHSKWLSFMSKRMRIASNLLNESGSIFISINDKEFAQLKLLCDQIFDEKNYLGDLSWESTTQPTNAGVAKYGLQKKTEHILFYAKNKLKIDKFVLMPLDVKNNYPHIGRYGQCRFQIIEKSDAGAYNRESMKFAILGQYPREGKRWQIGEETAIKLEKEGKLELVDGIVKIAIYPEDEQDKISFIPFWSLLLAKNVGTAQNGKDELNTILGRAVGFDTVKPSKLIVELLTHYKNDINILDFFAGSGTTGHAVMQLNKEDGGNRKFILCTNNENNICREITYERIKRVIAKEDYKASLKYMKVDYQPIGEQLYYEYADKLLLHIKELVELENGLDFDGNHKVAICLDDADLKTFAGSITKDTTYKAVYVGHDVLVTPEIEKILLGANVAIKIIPDYYYGELRG